jgi:hypothetical protein
MISPKLSTVRTRKAIFASAAVVIVLMVGALALFQSSEREPEVAEAPAANPGTTPDEPAAPEAVSQQGTKATSVSNRPAAPAAGQAPAQGQTSAQASAPAPAPAQCWAGKFAVQTTKLTAVQKESFGERAQKIRLAEMLSELSVQKINEARLCVRAGGHALSFEKDSKDPAAILVRGGSGRVNPKAALEVSYCLKAADCAPCKIKKDSFEDALLGESEEDAQANADEDVTAKLSPEVRRELARLENQSKPAAIDAWQLQSASTRCGRG